MLPNSYLYFLFSQPTCTSDKAQPQLASASRFYVKLHKKMNTHRQTKHQRRETARTLLWGSAVLGHLPALLHHGAWVLLTERLAKLPSAQGARHPRKGCEKRADPTREETPAACLNPPGRGRRQRRSSTAGAPCFKTRTPGPAGDTSSPPTRQRRVRTHTSADGARPGCPPPAPGSRSLPARPPLAAAGGPGSRPCSACAGPRVPDPVRAAHAAGAGHARGGAAGQQGRARGRGGAVGRGLGFPPPAAASGPGSPPEARALLTGNGLKRPKTRSDGAKRRLMATTSWRRWRSGGDLPSLPVPAVLGDTGKRQTRTGDGSRS